MPRYAFLTAYDGAPFSGWQYQDHAPSVQGQIEAALANLIVSDKRIVAAGRTDAGVHAMGQVFHFDFDKEWDEDRLEQALNFHLRPAPISILQAARVDDEFSARFSAEKRYYLYRIATRRAPLTFQKGQLWQVGRALDVDAMQAAADYLIGLHDFTTFRSSACQSASPVKTLDRLHIETVQGYEGTEIHFHVEARSFLHNQVRSFVGTLERVGRGSWTPLDVKDALEAKDRTACGPVAPACGLYLRKVDYPEDIFE